MLNCQYLLVGKAQFLNGVIQNGIQKSRVKGFVIPYNNLKWFLT